MKIRDDALTPVVSAAIALLIVTSTVGAVVIWGVPYTNDLRNKSTSENVKGQLDTLSKELNSLVNSNPGDKKIDTFSMDGGTISTSTKADRTVIMYSHSKDYEFTVTNIEGNNVFIRMIKPFNYPFNYTLDDARLSWSTCFLAGTKVLMADGSYKNIEDITVGEQVASYSEHTNTIESGFVSNVFHHSSNEMPDYYIIINDGLKVTPNHRFYSDDKWVYAGDLKIGDNLFSSVNKEYTIYSLQRVFEKEPSFDLEIEQCHTYFVSIANDGVNVLVHNPSVGGPPNPPSAFTATPLDRFRIGLSWTKASGTNIYTYIEAKLNSYPTSRTDGTNIYNNTGTSFSHTGLSPSQHWYYRAWSWNATSKTWSITYVSANTSTLSNNPPVYGIPNPTNGSNSQPLSLTWRISITDSDGDLISWTIKCSNGQQNSSNNQAGGIKSLSISGLTYSKTYKIWVNSTDGYGWTRRWYTFTTIASPIDYPPSKPSNPQPPDNSIDVPIRTILQWSPCTDPEHEQVSYEVYFGTATLEKFPRQNQTWFDPGILNYNTHYWWKIIAYDPKGNYNESAIWNFQTEANPNNPPSTPIYSSPSNHATNVSTTMGLFWNCSDPDGDILTYDVYLGKSTPPTLERSNWAYNSLSLLGLESNTKFYWKIVAKDEHGATTSGPIWDFTTKVSLNHPPNVPSPEWPGNNDTNVGIDLGPLGYALVWIVSDPDSDLVDCDIYFGTSNPPPLDKAHDPSCYCYDIINDTGLLQYNTTYYWQIVARDSHGATTAGPIWRFTTATNTNHPPNVPETVWPSNNETNVGTDLGPLGYALFWSVSDPDSDLVDCDIYFGTSNPPPLHKAHDTSCYVYDIINDTGLLQYNTTYYWQIVARDSHGATTAGPIWDFTTEQQSNNLSLQTLDATVLSGTSAVLHGKILDDGGENCQIRFRYREGYSGDWIYLSDWHGSYNTTNSEFSEIISELETKSICSFQAGVKNPLGESWGESKSFTTYYLQYVLTYDPVDYSITQNSATLRGLWGEPAGGPPLPTCQIRFKYSQNNYPDLLTFIAADTAGDVTWTYPSDWHGNYTPQVEGSFTELITGLAADTSYVYLAGSKNIVGEYWSNRYVEFVTMNLSVQTLDATDVTDSSATLHGKILLDGGGPCQIRFKYSQNNCSDLSAFIMADAMGEVNWTYPSDWHGYYNANDYFQEAVYDLSIGINYVFQAGVKNTTYETWGDYCDFTTYLHEGLNNIKTITPEHITPENEGNDNWLLNLSSYLPSPMSGIVVLDLYATEPTKERFGTIWIYDSNSLTYMKSENGITEGYAFEKGGILKYEEGKWHVEDTTQIGNWTNLFSIHVSQTIFSSFSESVSSNDVLKFKICSSLQSSYTGESKQIYNMRIQFDGDHKYEWRDYLKGKYLFEDDTIATEYPSLRYVPSENGVCLALAYSTINLVLN